MRASALLAPAPCRAAAPTCHHVHLVSSRTPNLMLFQATLRSSAERAVVLAILGPLRTPSALPELAPSLRSLQLAVSTAIPILAEERRGSRRNGRATRRRARARPPMLAQPRPRSWRPTRLRAGRQRRRRRWRRRRSRQRRRRARCGRRGPRTRIRREAGAQRPSQRCESGGGDFVVLSHSVVSDGAHDINEAHTTHDIRRRTVSNEAAREKSYAVHRIEDAFDLLCSENEIDTESVQFTQ